MQGAGASPGLRQAGTGPRAYLLDIEGTTTPISFVHETLFDFARQHLAAFLERTWSSQMTQDIVSRLAAEHAAETAGPPPWRGTTRDDLRESAVTYAHWLMDRDRKSPALKELQGLIWEEGYQAGQLRGVVWDDVPRAMHRWRKAGVQIAIYSSGSELAQRRLFASAPQGDLTGHIAAFFDTRVGPKPQPQSYRRIAEALQIAPNEICFVSDVTAELRAAREAGCMAVLAARPGNPPQADADAFHQITTFDEL